MIFFLISFCPVCDLTPFTVPKLRFTLCVTQSLGVSYEHEFSVIIVVFHLQKYFGWCAKYNILLFAWCKNIDAAVLLMVSGVKFCKYNTSVLVTALAMWCFP